MNTGDMATALTDLIGTGYLTPQEEGFLDDVCEEIYDYADPVLTQTQKETVERLYLKHKHRIE